MAQIIWSVRAADDLEEIAQFIALDKPDAAANYVAKLLESVEQLSDFPFKGRSVPELHNDNYREVVVPPCRVIYTPLKDAVLILRVIRGERQIRSDMLSQN